MAVVGSAAPVPAARRLSDKQTLIFLLLAPVLTFFIVFNTIPLLWLLGLSFHNYSLTAGVDPEFVGIRNYYQLWLGRNDFWGDLSRTFTYVATGVTIQTVLGMALGLLFWGSKSMPGRRLALTLLFAPMVLTPVAIGTFFRFMYDPTFGLFNAILRGLGFETIDFLGDPNYAFWAVLAVDCWMWTPFMTLMTLAALGSVPKAELEAAEVDPPALLQTLLAGDPAPRQVHPDARDRAQDDRQLQDARPRGRHDRRRPWRPKPIGGGSAEQPGVRKLQYGLFVGLCGLSAADLDRHDLDLHLRAQPAAEARSMTATRVKTFLYYGVLWLVALAFFTPVAWIILSSFKTREVILATPPEFIFEPTIQNYFDVFNQNTSFAQQLLNSLALSITSVIIAVMVSFLAAFCFSRFRPRGTDFLMFLLLSVRMLPAPAVILPVYLMYAALDWTNSHIMLMLFYAMFSIPFSVWILKGFIDGVSVRFDETGQASGASWFHIIFRVVLPQVRPGLIAAFIFNMIFVWNEYIFNFLIGGVDTQSVPIALAVGTYSDGGVNWTFIATVTSIYLLPPVLAIYAFQKYLLVGMTFGTVRGEV